MKITIDKSNSEFRSLSSIKILNGYSLHFLSYRFCLVKPELLAASKLQEKTHFCKQAISKKETVLMLTFSFLLLNFVC